MKHLRQIFVLWVFWVLLLWLMAPCLDLRPESAPQKKLMVLVPRHCNRPWLQLRTSGCRSETLNSSFWHHGAGEWTGFAARYEKTVEYLMGTTESLTPDTVLWWLGMNSENGLGKMWEKLFKVIPRPSVSHFHLYCGTCALVGNPKTLQASGLSHNINRMNQGHAQGFEMARNQTSGRFVYPGNVSIQDSWRQLVLLLKLSGLVWTSDDPSEEVSLFGFGTDQLMRWSHYWEDKYWFESDMHSFKEEQKVILVLQGEGKVAIYSYLSPRRP